MKLRILPVLLPLLLVFSTACGPRAAENTYQPPPGAPGPGSQSEQPQDPPAGTEPATDAPTLQPDKEPEGDVPPTEAPEENARGDTAPYGIEDRLFYQYRGLEIALPEGWRILDTVGDIEIAGDAMGQEIYLAAEPLQELTAIGQETLQKYHDAYTASLEEEGIPYSARSDYFIGPYPAIAYTAAQDRAADSMLTCVAVHMDDCFVIFMAVYTNENEKAAYELLLSTIRVKDSLRGDAPAQDDVISL